MLLVVGLLQVIWDLRVFTQIYVLQKAGGITRDTNLLGTYIYRLGIGGGDFGAAAAVAIFMLALTVAADRAVRRARCCGEEDVSTAWRTRVPPPSRSAPTSSACVVFVVCAFPVYWMVNTSLLPRSEIRAPDPTWRAVRRHPRQLPAGASRAAGSSTRSRSA